MMKDGIIRNTRDQYRRSGDAQMLGCNLVFSRVQQCRMLDWDDNWSADSGSKGQSDTPSVGNGEVLGDLDATVCI